MTEIDRFITIFRRFCAAKERAEATVSLKVLGGGGQFKKILAGGDIGVRYSARVIQRLREEWPYGKPLPPELGGCSGGVGS